MRVDCIVKFLSRLNSSARQSGLLLFAFSSKSHFLNVAAYIQYNVMDNGFDKKGFCECFFVCVEVLRPSQPNGVMSSVVSLPNYTFTGQA